MKLLFDYGVDGEHIEAITTLPRWWDATDDEYDDYYIDYDAYLEEDGSYECCVSLVYETATDAYKEWSLANFKAEDEESACRLLELAADALYE